METYLLNNGIVALAKRTALGLHPITYTNFKQADRKAEELKAQGIDAYVYGYGNPAKYIALTEATHKAHQARELGRQAHRDGKPCIPAQDPEVLKLLEGNEIGEGIPTLDAWLRGWHIENRKG